MLQKYVKKRRLFLIIIFIIAVILASILFFLNRRVVKPWKSFEGKVCDGSRCYTSEVHQKYNYWLYKAAEERNPGLCNNVEALGGGTWITKEETMDFCKARYGGRIGDIDYCLKLDRPFKYMCLEEMLENVDEINICDKFPTDLDPVNARYECYSKVAEKTRDITICQRIPEQGYNRHYRGSKENCLIAVGEKLNNSEVCQYLTGERSVGECVEKVEGRYETYGVSRDDVFRRIYDVFRRILGMHPE